MPNLIFIMNKSLYLLLFSLFLYTTASAQEFSFGIKAGANYVSGGQITGISSGGLYTDDAFEAESDFGFHGGAFLQVKFGKFFLRPEVIYSSMKTTFPFPRRDMPYEVDKISVPLLLGYNVWGPIDIYAGPAYQKILDASLDLEDNSLVIAQNSPLAAQAGIKFNFRRFELDLRYDRTFATEEPYDVDIDNSVYGINRATFDDGRLNQFLLSISFKIFDTEADPGRRRGGCYF